MAVNWTQTNNEWLTIQHWYWYAIGGSLHLQNFMSYTSLPSKHVGNSSCCSDSVEIDNIGEDAIWGWEVFNRIGEDIKLLRDWVWGLWLTGDASREDDTDCWSTDGMISCCLSSTVSYLTVCSL